MSSVISSMIGMLFPKVEFRCLMIGLDASGKTTILYKMKLGEIVTTIPTIGFNVETIEVGNTSLTMWDVGGCDKIRPLWRHYYQNTQAIVFIIDSNDRMRMTDHDGYGDHAKAMFESTLLEAELKDAVVLVFCNKQDLPNAYSVSEIKTLLDINKHEREGKIIHCQGCCATSGDGLEEGFQWLQKALISRRNNAPVPLSLEPKPPKPPTPEEAEKNRMESLLIEWLERVDDADNVFISKVKDFTLDNWDHYTHLRLAWIILTQHGRQEGLPIIFTLIKDFIANSPRTQRSRGTTFHETMTYFWVHMLHYAMVATKLPKNDFKTYLLMNPQLSNGGLFLHYYSKQRMLHDADARVMVLLPDKQPLPSLVTSTTHTDTPDKNQGNSTGVLKLVPSAPLTDDQFFTLFETQRLPGWGHEVKLRVIYLLLCKYGRNSASVDYILSRLAIVEKENAHVTLTYFWIQMVTYHILVEVKSGNTLKESDSNKKAIFDAFNNSEYTIPSIPTATSSITAVNETSSVQNGESTDAEVVVTEGDSSDDKIDKVSTALVHSRISTPTSISTSSSTNENSNSNMKFSVFIQLPHCQPLKNMLLYEKYYSRSVIDSKDAEIGLALPNLKQFPQLV